MEIPRPSRHNAGIAVLVAGILSTIFAFIVSSIVSIIALGLVFSFLLSWPVYMLWNGCLVGAIDAIHPITWLQAWGLTILCSFLFKSANSKSKSKSSD